MPLRPVIAYVPARVLFSCVVMDTVVSNDVSVSLSLTYVLPAAVFLSLDSWPINLLLLSSCSVTKKSPSDVIKPIALVPSPVLVLALSLPV